MPIYVPKKLKRFLKMKDSRVQISRISKGYYIKIRFEIPESEPYEPKDGSVWTIIREGVQG